MMKSNYAIVLTIPLYVFFTGVTDMPLFVTIVLGIPLYAIVSGTTWGLLAPWVQLNPFRKFEASIASVFWPLTLCGVLPYALGVAFVDKLRQWKHERAEKKVELPTAKARKA
jgi:hypothetical protein